MLSLQGVKCPTCASEFVQREVHLLPGGKWYGRCKWGHKIHGKYRHKVIDGIIISTRVFGLVEYYAVATGKDALHFIETPTLTWFSFKDEKWGETSVDEYFSSPGVPLLNPNIPTLSQHYELQLLHLDMLHHQTAERIYTWMLCAKRFQHLVNRDAALLIARYVQAKPYPPLKPLTRFEKTMKRASYIWKNYSDLCVFIIVCAISVIFF
jgi:hypothetical protein